jgi:hypothetical protein
VNQGDRRPGWITTGDVLLADTAAALARGHDEAGRDASGKKAAWPPEPPHGRLTRTRLLRKASPVCCVYLARCTVLVSVCSPLLGRCRACLAELQQVAGGGDQLPFRMSCR